MAWKILVTIMITLIILVVVLSTNPQIGAFFNGIFGRFGSVIEPEIERDVQFTLALDSYDKIAYDSSRPVNITINVKKMETKVSDVALNISEKNISITNYRGKVEVNGTTMTLDGSFEAFLLPGAASFPRGTLITPVSFNDAKLENFGPKELVMNATGTLTVGASQNRFSGIISIDSSLGTFDFQGASARIDARAKHIAIPDSGINVGKA